MMARHAYPEHYKPAEGDVWYLPTFARFMRRVRHGRWQPITDAITNGNPRHAVKR